VTNKQLELVIADMVAVFGPWGPDTSLDEMRKNWDGIFANVKPTVGATTEAADAGGVRGEFITAPHAAEDQVILYFHGGGYVLGSIDSHRDMCERFSRSAKARVLALDYSLAPERPFPAAVYDATTAYHWLIDQGILPSSIAIAGDSAGGGLAFATLVAARDAGDPMPACGVTISPWVDLEATGDSMQSKSAEDPMVQRSMIQHMGQTYVPNGDLKNPLAAPLHASLEGLPPLLIQVGSRETLLDDAVRMGKKAEDDGVDVTLDVWDGQVHVFQIFASRLDEGELAIKQLGAFVRKHMQQE